MTRAQQKLTLSYAENRYKWGTPTMCEPSRFISEIPEQYIDQPRRITKAPSFRSDDNFSNILSGSVPKSHVRPNLKSIHKLADIPASKNGPQDPEQDIQAGMDVEHERFGKGKVMSIEGNGPNKKATVLFKGIGQKQLLLRFAKLTIL